MCDQSTLSEFEDNSGSEPESYKCQICGDIFDSAKGRGIHIGYSHGEEEIKQVLLTELQSLSKKLDKTPSQRDMDKQGAHGHKTYQKKFGSWNKALTEAGLVVNKEHSISKSDLIDELVRLSNELGRTPTSRDMAKDGEYGTSTYANKFDSWNDALQEAGFEPTRERSVSREFLIDELKRVTEKLGKPPNTTEMKKHGCYGVSTFSSEFGTWNKALKTADVGTNKEKNIPKSDLLAEIHNLSEKLGRTPSAIDMTKKGGYGVGAYERSFGSWNGAIQQAGFEVNNRSNIPKTELLDALQCLGDDLDRTPTAVDMEQEGQFGWATYKTAFGSWNDALIEAGYGPHNSLNPDHLDHTVDSVYEIKIADILLDIGVEYKNEGIEISYDTGRTYRPDFVTNNYVIEVKGEDWGMVYDKQVTDKQKAEAAMNALDKCEYVVVGTELPADIHIPWENREAVRDLFD